MKKIVSAIICFICAVNIHAQDNVNREAKVPLTQWAVNSNYSKSDKGQLIINLPVQAAMVCLVNKSGDAKTFAYISIIQKNCCREVMTSHFGE
jgi:hypothetical protein